MWTHLAQRGCNRDSMLCSDPAMKIQLEPQDIGAIAQRVVELLKPYLLDYPTSGSHESLFKN